MAEEGLKKTQNDLIHIGCPIPFDIDVFLGQLEELMDAAYKNKGKYQGYFEKCSFYLSSGRIKNKIRKRGSENVQINRNETA